MLICFQRFLIFKNDKIQSSNHWRQWCLTQQSVCSVPSPCRTIYSFVNINFSQRNDYYVPYLWRIEFLKAILFCLSVSFIHLEVVLLSCFVHPFQSTLYLFVLLIDLSWITHSRPTLSMRALLSLVCKQYLREPLVCLFWKKLVTYTLLHLELDSIKILSTD